jgi:MADS-box transcription factor
MADITDQHDQTSPTDLDDAHSVGNGNAAIESRGIKRARPSTADDEDDDDEKGGRERRKIEIKFISDKSRRHITFSKRKAGIMKKVCLHHPNSSGDRPRWLKAACHASTRRCSNRKPAANPNSVC